MKKMWLIWKSPKTRRRYIIGTLSEDEEKYSFEYINPELEDAQKASFDYFPGFENLNKKYVSKNGMFVNILTRLPNVKRPDYLEILNLYNLDINSSKMKILEKTKGRLITDDYEFVLVFDKNKIEFEVAGTKYCKDLEKCKEYLDINQNLYLEKDLLNKYDKYAIKIMYKNNENIYHLGYVPRYYTKQLFEILDKDIKYSAMIKCLNFGSMLNDEDITANVKIIFNKN